MWALTNETPYAAERTWIRDKEGVHHWLVAVKATFSIEPSGQVALAEEQLAPLLEPEYFGEPGASSIRYESDLAGRKPSAEILVNAHAHAPGGRPTAELTVGLQVGSLIKQLVVRGPSNYSYGAAGLSATRPQPFVTQAIVYEYAWGGTDTLEADPGRHGHDPRNPVGCGFALAKPHLSTQDVARIYYPDGSPERVGPAGFGALASYWSPRLELHGTYDARWSTQKKPLLPDDWDEACLLCSPADQRPADRLQGGETVALLNLSPEEVMQFQLPRRNLSCTTRIRAQTTEHPFELASVIVEPEDRRLIMVWQASLRVPAPNADYLDESIIRERPSP